MVCRGRDLIPKSCRARTASAPSLAKFVRGWVGQPRIRTSAWHGACARRQGLTFRRRSEEDDAGAQAALIAVAALAVSAARGPRYALAGVGQPSPWQLGLQQAATPMMEDIVSFHDFLLIDHHGDHAVRAGAADLDRRFKYQCARPIRSRPRPRHNTLLKSPGPWSRCIILVVIAVPSFRLLFCAARPFRRPTSPSRRPASSGSGPTIIRTTAFDFDSLMLQDKDLQAEPAAPARGRQRDRRAGQQDGPRPGDRRRRDPRLRGAVLRHQDRRRSRPAERDLVQGRP